MERPLDQRGKNKLVHQVVGELRETAASGEFEPTADIDMVWVLSAPGTAKEASNDGAYSGVSFDRMNIDKGVETVLRVTALRLGKPVEEVTREDVETSGPVLFYNGEDAETEKVNYLQNEAFKELISEPDFPVPESKIVVDRIPTISTVPQVKGLAEYLSNSETLPRKVAAVSLFPHGPRVGRYIEHYRDMFPEGIEFVNTPVNVKEVMGEKAIGTVLREVRKVPQYFDKGDLAAKSAFTREESDK
jgi:hypothetical protein